MIRKNDSFFVFRTGNTCPAQSKLRGRTRDSMAHSIEMEFSQHSIEIDLTICNEGFPARQTGDQFRCNVRQSTFNQARQAYESRVKAKRKLVRRRAIQTGWRSIRGSCIRSRRSTPKCKNASGT
jgi:hypothetical protein